MKIFVGVNILLFVSTVCVASVFGRRSEDIASSQFAYSQVSVGSGEAVSRELMSKLRANNINRMHLVFDDKMGAGHAFRRQMLEVIDPYRRFRLHLEITPDQGKYEVSNGTVGVLFVAINDAALKELLKRAGIEATTFYHVEPYNLSIRGAGVKAALVHKRR